MLILLPPSAGKTTPPAGPALDLDSLIAPELNLVRERVIAQLQEVSASPDALKTLKVGSSLEPEVRAQIDFYDQPCAPAWQVYTGVLYSAADFAGMDAQQLRRADGVVRIFSGVFGVTGPTDLIPSYRLAMNTKLPDFGVQRLWKMALREEIAALNPDGLVVDARSSEYRVWDPPSSEHVMIGAARIKGGRRSVVSHAAKYYRGLLIGALLRATNPPCDVMELAEFAHTLVDRGHVTGVEIDPAHGCTPAKLTLVEDLG
ncbi:YaaA family protein [Trueperella pyogenes]